MWLGASTCRDWGGPARLSGGNRVFLTTAVDAQGTEQPEEGFYLGKDRGGLGEHRWLVLACDLNTGTKLWERQVHQAVPACTPPKSSYASATPVTDGERVHAWFGEFGLLVALPLTGYGEQITGDETLLANQVFVGGKMMIEARWPNLADSDDLSNRADFRPIAKDAWTAGPGGTAILRDAGIPEIAGGCSEDLGRLVLSTNGSMTAKHCISGPPVAECQSPDALQPVRIPLIVPAQYPDLPSQRLGNHEPVKGIPVMQRKAFHESTVRGLQTNLESPGFTESFGNQDIPVVLDLEIETAPDTLEGDLPKAHCRVVQRLRSLNDPPGPPRQTPVAV